MGNHDLGAIGIFESHIGETTERVGRDMIGPRDNEFAEMTKQVIIIWVGHVSRRFIDSGDAQTVRAPARVRTMIGIERNIPQFNCPGPVLDRLHQHINGADRGDRRSC